MKLNTKRLTIIPLNIEQFRVLLDGVGKLEKLLRLDNSNEKLDSHAKKAMEELFKECKKHKEKYLWYTNWQIILNNRNLSIGSACFMGYCGSDGTVEIGYGINEKYRCNGYMTEVVNSMCQWALKDKKVLRIIAGTDKDNTASQKVLKKCGFIIYDEDHEKYLWQLNDKLV
ncbi:GNAT family N-acetyltransferase [Clostridium sp.]|uniref:GNAT family N-acetyltransferase n=1 Tax=Clostridium sp. TaxID=1506 RepID=UPI002FDE67B9